MNFLAELGDGISEAGPLVSVMGMDLGVGMSTGMGIGSGIGWRPPCWLPGMIMSLRMMLQTTLAVSGRGQGTGHDAGDRPVGLRHSHGQGHDTSLTSSTSMVLEVTSLTSNKSMTSEVTPVISGRGMALEIALLTSCGSMTLEITSLAFGRG